MTVVDRLLLMRILVAWRNGLGVRQAVAYALTYYMGGRKRWKKKSILQGIIDFGMYNTLEERLRNSPEYKKSRKRVGKALKKLDDLGLSEEQMDVIDDVLTVCNENAAIYMVGKLIYKALRMQLQWY